MTRNNMANRQAGNAAPIQQQAENTMLRARVDNRFRAPAPPAGETKGLAPAVGQLANEPEQLSVPRRFQELCYATERLDGIVETLELRLSPVMSPRERANLDEAPAVIECELGAALSRVVEQVRAAVSRLESMQQRLEV